MPRQKKPLIGVLLFVGVFLYLGWEVVRQETGSLRGGEWGMEGNGGTSSMFDMPSCCSACRMSPSTCRSHRVPPTIGFSIRLGFIGDINTPARRRF